MSTLTVEHQKNLRFVRAFLLIISSLTLPAAVLANTPTWQGPYVGAYLGSSFGNNHTSTNVGSVTDTSYFTTLADVNAVNNAGTSTENPHAAIVGIQAGHDWVWNQAVYGIAFDYGLLPLSSSKSVNNISYPDNSDTYSVYTTMSTKWLFTLRGRLGYQTTLHWPTLLYLTGGLAMTQLKVNNSFSDNSALAGTGENSISENKVGWIAGAGIELATFNHASVVLEYLYVKVPTVKVTNTISNTEGGFGIPTQSMTSSFSTIGQFHTSLLRLGLNYRFDE